MVGVLTDIGMVRSINEDCAEYVESDKYSIYVVADGMGGHNAGEVASSMAVKGIIEYIETNFGKADNYKILRNAIQSVNKSIYNHSIKNDNLNGMGTTITAGLKFNDVIQIANVGDSSCYGIKGEVINKITKDHSLVQELVDLGTISELEAVNHPKKNIITRAVGTSESVEVDVFNLSKDDYDIYVLCSDGLTNEVTKEEILKVIKEGKLPVDTCEKLVNLAKYKGGRDNVTVLLFGGEM